MAITFVGTPEAVAFGVSQAGFSYNFNGAGAPAVGQTDILFVNSDATIVTPSGFTLDASSVVNEGVYAFRRKATGGEAATVLITTAIGGGPFNAVLGWARLANADSLDKFPIATASGSDTSTPALSTGVLAGSTEIVLAYAGLHNFGVTPTAPVWGGGLSALGDASVGTGLSGTAGFMGSVNAAGPAAVSPSVSWTSGVNDRVIVALTFTESAVCTDCPDCGSNPCATISGDDPAFTIAGAILDCAYNAVDNTGALEIKRKCVVPGAIAWDSCQCGQLVISESRRYGSSNFPLEEVDNEAECGEPYLVVSLTLSLTRCVPISSATGVPPSCDVLSVAAAQLMRDKRNIRSAVMCCLTQIYDASGSVLMGFQLGAHETVGPEGQCAGSELTILLGFANPCGC